ncbi:MAG: hypothetical protein CVU28_07750 [Betaproteobacteria bacterium HGW-Betaproteobacteria-21]|nr:MAG: hypothetical protein CVU28_07750 [Betaproteobacteria bacterium HGW-Betaproteobacteria-21]
MEYQFASLMPEDEPAVTLHLLSLDEEDRALRFGSCTSDVTLVEYVQNLNFNRDVAEGAWDGGRLVGFAHLAVYPEAGYPVGELGLSISRGYRARGIAARLIRHAVLRARRFRLTTMYIHYMRRNLAMTRLVRHLGLKVAYEGDEARASLEVTPHERSIHCEAHRGGHNGRLEVFKSLPPRAAGARGRRRWLAMARSARRPCRSGLCGARPVPERARMQRTHTQRPAVFVIDMVPVASTAGLASWPVAGALACFISVVPVPGQCLKANKPSAIASNSSGRRGSPLRKSRISDGRQGSAAVPAAEVSRPTALARF